MFSAFWMVGDTYYIANTTARADQIARQDFYKTCMEQTPGAGCDKIADAFYAPRFGPLWREAAEEATIWLALLLIVFAALYWSVRWVMAGRRDYTLPSEKMRSRIK